MFPEFLIRLPLLATGLLAPAELTVVVLVLVLLSLLLMLTALPPVVALAVPPLPAPEVADRLCVLLSELFESFWVTLPPLFAAFWPPLTVVVLVLFKSFVLFEFLVLPDSRLLPLA